MLHTLCPRTAAAIRAALRISRRRLGARQRLHEFHSALILCQRQGPHFGPVFRLAPGKPMPELGEQYRLARQQAAAIVCAACQCTRHSDPFGVGCDCVWACLPSTKGANV